MDHISLYRKYRPMNFENLVGQEHIKTTLKNAIVNNRLAHAYLFAGPRGIGKTTTARLVAKALNCTNLKDGFDPCEECDFCKDISDGRFIDMIEIDAASNRGINEVRDLKEKIGFAPSRSKYKVYIIDEVHMMTNDAFNALLKTLEEPPPHAYFVLATTELHKIPETIISRCQSFDFKRIAKETMMDRLKKIAKMEGIEADEKAIEIIARYSDGGLRDAIGLLEQLSIDKKLSLEYTQDILGLTSFSLLEKLSEHLLTKNLSGCLKIINDLHIQGSDIKQFIQDLLALLRDRMLENIYKNNTDTAIDLLRMIEVLQVSQKTQNSSIPQLSLEIATIKIIFGQGQMDSFPSRSASKNISEPKSITPSPLPQKSENSVPVMPETKSGTISAVTDPKPESNTDPTSSDINSNMELTPEQLKEKWPRIFERIKKPALRMSLKHAVPVTVDSKSILLQFNTVFHKEQVMEIANLSEIEAEICQFFGKPYKLSSVVKELEIKPVINDEQGEYSSQPLSSENSANADKAVRTPNSQIDQALNIFGGQLM